MKTLRALLEVLNTLKIPGESTLKITLEPKGEVYQGRIDQLQLDESILDLEVTQWRVEDDLVEISIDYKYWFNLLRRSCNNDCEVGRLKLTMAEAKAVSRAVKVSNWSNVKYVGHHEIDEVQLEGIDIDIDLENITIGDREPLDMIENWRR